MCSSQRDYVYNIPLVEEGNENHVNFIVNPCKNYIHKDYSIQYLPYDCNHKLIVIMSQQY